MTITSPPYLQLSIISRRPTADPSMADAHPVAIGRNCNSRVTVKFWYWTALQKHLSITATTAIVAGSRIGRTPDDVHGLHTHYITFYLLAVFM